MRSFAPLLSFALFCAACAPLVPAGTPSPDTPAPAGPIAPPAAEDASGFAKSSNALAFDLYGKARSQSGNLALSPISISTALTMTWGGARGETAAQMKNVLHAEGEADKAMEIAGSLLGSFGGGEGKVTLRVANRLFGEKTYAFDQGYLDRTRAAFGAPLEAIDFRGAPDPARLHINEWVAKQTQDRIRDLLPPTSLDTDTRLVLTNAIYFLGDWYSPFSKEATRPTAFHATATTSRDVPMMNQVALFSYAATDGVKLLEMPYQGGEVVMTLVLPDAPDGVAAVEQRLSPEVLTRWVGATRRERVQVALPRFEINPAGSLSLGDTLTALGMPLAFDVHRADFTGMIGPANAGDRLFISKVFHKAFVKVDEKGTEAAAATAVVISLESAALPSAPAAEFHADHPFLFFLRHVKSGAILFMGRVSDPTAR